MLKIRLNKHIADSGLCSRRKADELIAAGKVSVNGKRVSEAGIKINPDKDDVKVEGKPLPKQAQKIYLAFHKPKGVVTTRKDPQKRKTVYDCLPEAVHSVDPAGRLDRDSTGLLILSNDGDLVYRLTHPKYHFEKVYNVTLNKPLTEKHARQLQEGVLLKPENKTAQMKHIEIIEGRKNHYRVVLLTGYNRQIRRSMMLLGYDVTSLKRIDFGPVKLGSLAPGKIRPLSPGELKKLGVSQAIVPALSRTRAKKRPK